MRVFYACTITAFTFILLTVFLSNAAHTASKTRSPAPFTAVDDSLSVHSGTYLNLVANDDLAGYNPSISVVDQPSHGYLNGPTMYVPDYGFTGTDTYTYRLCAGVDCSNTATVTLNVVNAPPIISGHSVVVPVNGARCVPVFEGVYDPEGDNMGDVSILSYPLNGWLTGTTLGDPCGKVYHANYSFSGIDYFTYRQCDTMGACSGTKIAIIYVLDNRQGSCGDGCPQKQDTPPETAIRPPSAEQHLGRPVNIATGNVWLRQQDYSLPGTSENLEVTRFYNSLFLSPSGMFGPNWSTQYDESLSFFGTSFNDQLIRVNMPDSRGALFGRENTTDPWKSFQAGPRGAIVRETDGSYTLTFNDGRKHRFDSAGKLQWQKDRHGNQTTLNYNTSGVLTSVTDPYSRTLTLNRNSNGVVSSIADSTGTVATYTYYSGGSSPVLKDVTYADGSKFQFEYTTRNGNPTYLTAVKDALDNVLESHTYNTAGWGLTSEVASGQEKYTMNYVDAQYGLTYVTDGLGRTSTYEFDTASWKVKKVTKDCSCGTSGQQITQYFYNSGENIVKKVDALSNEITYTYDSEGNITRISDPTGADSFTYNAYGEVLTHTDHVGNVTTHTYNSTGDLLTTSHSQRNPLVSDNFNDNSINTSLWNTSGSVTESSGRLNTPATNNGGSYARTSLVDFTNKYAQVKFHAVPSTGSAGYTAVRLLLLDSTLSHFSMANIDTATGQLEFWVADAKRSSITFNPTSHRYVRIAHNSADGKIYFYASADAMTWTALYNYPTTQSYTSTYAYLDIHNWGNLSGTATAVFDDFLLGPGALEALNDTVTFGYTSGGKLASITDARNNARAFTYDTSGRMTKITDANNKETNFGYNARAQVTSVTNALSEITSFGYDSRGRLNEITYPDSNEVNVAYDLAGRRTSVTDENGRATTYAYDSAYRLTGITDALNHSTTFGYDSMSNLTSQTDALGNVTNSEYDDFNRPKKVIYPAPSPSATPRLEETFTYDKIGNLKTRTDTAGHTTSYDYDAGQRLTRITDALNNSTLFTYDSQSRVIKVTDALNQEYTFSYDAVGRVLSQERNGTLMSFGYDGAGNRTSRTDYNGNATTYTYDDLNRLTAIAYTGTSSEYASYGYDDLSRLTSAINQNGTVSFTYNNRGRLATETDVFGHVLGYTYDAAGNRTALTLDSNAHTGYAYDYANRLTTLTDESSNNFTFTYDNANKLTARVAPNGVTSTYTYDGMSRLKELKHATTSTTLYDDVFAYNSANQISQIAGLSQTRNFTYDNINRLTAVTVGGSTVESYSYDAVGNRTASHLSSSYTTGSFNRLTATNSASYTYNANGSMTGKTVGSTNWTYGWDRENRMVTAGDGTTSASYQYDALGRRIKRTQGSDVQKYTNDGNDVALDDVNSTLTKYQNGPGIDNKLELRSGSTSKYFLTDHLGSSALIADSSGGSADSNGFDSFGNATNGSFTSRYQFTGRERDSLTGLQYSRARFYDPTLGRFVSEDPIGFKGGDVNLYGYVRNSPVKFIDPSGKALLPILGGGAIVLSEAFLHKYLSDRAETLFPTENDQWGRKKHCYVNCMSTRLHLSPGIATLFSVGQEGGNLLQAAFGKDFWTHFQDSVQDMNANIYGQGMAIILSKSCAELCENCPHSSEL